ncbi:helix-turn-helix transcriptional regulator [Shewanella oneidensis MR-1]|uniref:Mu phage transcriptional regulator Cro/CI family C n=2 Tax=Shewanella oneidensis TaxID=70863 RepID=Q8EDU1_SHEON|nr:XRE family transcriptional regulator [Shewanella oneidensis]AAN55680.1 Mu phage transcriptional regulator Cro/CI family C [Shewanella oneidensis MR-1]MEE2026270.1 putative HTH-type transcriptional regulator [Shewanella oneidensis]QKG97154.1 helix-turn-helix transcriptional regulator [Shewanella oneidensis MR-1]
MSYGYDKNADDIMKNADHIFEIKGIMRFPDRLKESIGDISIRSFAKKCGLSEGVMRNYLAGKTYPSLDKLALMAEVSNKPLDWLVAGTEHNFNELNEPGSKYVIGINLEEYALIPGYRVQVSAGHGALNCDQQDPVRYLAFRRKWLKYRGFEEHELAIVWAKGDSMEPTIHSNDTLVVHLGRNSPADGHIYIFRNGDDLFVKRYQNAFGSWRLISDNPVYDKLDIPKHEQHQFEVVGQVVHIAKDIGD